MKILIIATCFIVIGCQPENRQEVINNEGTDSTNIITNELELEFDFKGTVWTNQVFPDNSDCIDVIRFQTGSIGTYYSCEHDQNDSITYKFDNGKLVVNVWDYKSEVDITEGKHISSKYFLDTYSDKLVMTDIQHLRAGKYESVDKKFLTQVYNLEISSTEGDNSDFPEETLANQFLSDSIISIMEYNLEIDTAHGHYEECNSWNTPEKKLLSMIIKNMVWQHASDIHYKFNTYPCEVTGELTTASGQVLKYYLNAGGYVTLHNGEEQFYIGCEKKAFEKHFLSIKPTDEEYEKAMEYEGE